MCKYNMWQQCLYFNKHKLIQIQINRYFLYSTSIHMLWVWSHKWSHNRSHPTSMTCFALQDFTTGWQQLEVGICAISPILFITAFEITLGGVRQAVGGIKLPLGQRLPPLRRQHHVHLDWWKGWMSWCFQPEWRSIPLITFAVNAPLLYKYVTVPPIPSPSPACSLQ